MIYNDGYELDDFGRAIKCPTCENEETSSNYCKICGSFLINRCTNIKCGIICEGNARFCTDCGHETVFNLEGYLFNWNRAKQKIEEEEEYMYQQYISQQNNEDDDIPF